MGASIEFNASLALRVMAEYHAGRRRKEECVPEVLAVGEVHTFWKSGHRIYRLDLETPLRQTTGNCNVTRPLASVLLLEVTHVLVEGEPVTRGSYRIVERFDPNDPTVHFEGILRAPKP
ncbi:hypothetical protein HY632_01955 [Candidatus Uhrbacteria bacterium]|nr:hypothetical protein [Candidatus Uhrbacteria bacterium]